MIKARAVMRTDVIAVARGESIREAIRILVLNNVTGLPVINEDGTLAGIVTEKDLLGLFHTGHSPAGKVEDFMTTEVVCFDEEDSLADVVGCLMAHSFRSVPILRQDRLAGIISRRDIVAHISNFRYGEDVLERESVFDILY